MKSEKWYQCRLARYFEEHYSQYEDVAEFWNDPAPNQWLFDIYPLGSRIEITCTDKGVIKEERYRVEIDILYDTVKDASKGFDAIYEDYIISLVGEDGFYNLRKAKLLTTCGSINGRNLYTLN